MTATGTLIRPPSAPGQCPSCGSFLDSPRIDPATGLLGRKCASCVAWVREDARPAARRRPRWPS